MIDVKTHQKFVPRPPDSRSLRDGLYPGVFNDDEPPDGDFSLLLPGSVVGFDMHAKRWRKFSDDINSNAHVG
jgi:hypothetical protein